jgi:hypothetical protein
MYFWCLMIKLLQQISREPSGPRFSWGRVTFQLPMMITLSTYKLRDNMRVLYSAAPGPDARSVYRQASVSPGR